jgi:hypothetical protein
MTLSSQIRKQIDKIPSGKTFGYKDLGIPKEDYVAGAKVLERLLKKSLIKRISKGLFYKAEETAFGELKPDYMEQLSSYLYENQKRIAYETGIKLYNRMGLTSQISSRTKIACRSKRININKGYLKADAVKSYAEVTEDNYELLGLLDAFKDIKKIPDSSINQTIKRLNEILKTLEFKQINMLVKYALLYPPRVRALIGAVLENSENPNINLDKLKNSLNPLTKIKLGLREKDLPTLKKWNIE